MLNLSDQPRRLWALDSTAQSGGMQGQAFGARRVKWGAESAGGLPGNLCRHSIFPSGWGSSVLRQLTQRRSPGLEGPLLPRSHFLTKTVF